MKILSLFVLLSLALSEITFSQGSDSVVTTKKVDFIKKLKETKGYVYPVRSRVPDVFVKIPTGVYSEKEQVLMKVGDDIYLRFDATGFLFKLTDLTDSLATFRRLDITININYCIGSFNFISGNDIYNYGGYGFWKSNGLIRKYDPRSREWSIIKTNEEIPQQIFKVNNAWFDPKNNFLYTAYRVDINAALKEDNYMYGKVTPTTYRFDFKTSDWSAIGKTSEYALNILTGATLFLSTYKGLMVLGYEQLYMFDFENNQILKLNDNVFAQLYMRITDVNSVFHKDKTLYMGNRESGKVDSVRLDLDNFRPVGESIYNPIKDYTWAFFLGGIVLLIIVAFSIKLIIDKKVAKLKPSGQEIKNYKFEFSDIEKSLIHMLLEKSKSNQTATISEINYVLGVKDKNIGLQKKVRSEVFNAVNEKFKLISDWDEPLVQSIRSESDKRYFEYMIRKDMIKEAERVMQG